ncbi:MAG: hypothetical protein WC799_08420 [Desulfobacteraceae bacterium]
MPKAFIRFFITIMVLTFSSLSLFAADNPATSGKDPSPGETVSTERNAAKEATPTGQISDVEKLQQAIKSLEDKLNKMSEENDIRRRLETTEEEKNSADESILSAAGRDYTLMKPGSMGLELNLAYTGDAYDSVTSSSSAVSVNHNAYHTVTSGFYIEYPIEENFTTTINIPFVYKYNSQTNRSTAKDVSDIGDVSFGCQLQPVKSGGGFPSLILSGALSCPSGRSPYKIDTTREISTGSGGYSVSLGCNLSKSVDPVVAFGGVQVGHSFDISGLNFKSGSQGETGTYLQGVKPGDTFSFSMGIGYSLSYKVNLTLGYQYSYQTKTRYDWVGLDDIQSEGSISSVLNIGTGWNLSPRKSMNIKVGIGLTANDPAFSVSVRVPFTYDY